jgi:hypothetical protein
MLDGAEQDPYIGYNNEPLKEIKPLKSFYETEDYVPF